MALAGIITGLVGSIGSNVFSWLTLREKNKYAIAEMAHQEKRWGHEKELLVLQSQANVSEFEMQTLIEQVRGSFTGLEMSIKSQIANATNASKRANSIIMFFRPLLTLVLMFAMFYFSKKMLTDKFPNAAYGIIAIIDLGSMAVAWWFGDRSLKRGVQSVMSAGNVRAAGGDF